MRIAFITPVFPPYAAGMATVAEAHAEALARAGHEVTVFSPLGKRGLKMSSKYHTVSLRARVRYGNAAAVPSLARISGFDRYLLEYPFVGGTEFLLQNPSITRENLRVYYHMDLHGRGWTRPIFYLYTNWVLPRLMRCALRVAVSSLDYAKTGLLRDFITHDEAKFTEIPIGVDAARFCPSTATLKTIASEAKSPYGRSPAGRQSLGLLLVAALDRAHYFKGVEVLLRALKNLPDARLMIVGDGDQRKKYERLAAELGVASRVKFSGKVASKDLPAYYHEADVVVLPSIDRSEAFGIVLLEAMASGRAVVASDLPGVRTLVRENGLLARPGDAADLQAKIGSLVADSARLHAMGARGRQMVLEKYSLEKVDAQFERWMVS